MTYLKHETHRPASLSEEAQTASMNEHAAPVDAQDGGGHTPGPWKAESYYGTTDRPEVIGSNRSIAVVQQLAETYTDEQTGMPKKRLVTNEEVWANARLIATAPRMLEALEHMVIWAERHGLTKAELITGGYCEVPVIGIAREAIREAKGLAV